MQSLLLSREKKGKKIVDIRGHRRIISKRVASTARTRSSSSSSSCSPLPSLLEPNASQTIQQRGVVGWPLRFEDRERRKKRSFGESVCMPGCYRIAFVCTACHNPRFFPPTHLLSQSSRLKVASRISHKPYYVAPPTGILVSQPPSCRLSIIASITLFLNIVSCHNHDPHLPT